LEVIYGAIVLAFLKGGDALVQQVTSLEFVAAGKPRRENEESCRSSRAACD